MPLTRREKLNATTESLVRIVEDMQITREVVDKIIDKGAIPAENVDALYHITDLLLETVIVTANRIASLTKRG